MEHTVSQRDQARSTPDSGARDAPECGDLPVLCGRGPGDPRPVTVTGLPVIDSPQAAGRALGELFLANADRGDDAANDHLVTELVRRIRAQQDSRGGGRDQPPSQPTGTAAERPPPTVPAPLFPTKTPAGRQLSSPAPHPAPGGQPDPRPRAGESSDDPLRWARCPDDGHLHLLRPTTPGGC